MTILQFAKELSSKTRASIKCETSSEVVYSLLLLKLFSRAVFVEQENKYYSTTTGLTLSKVSRTNPCYLEVKSAEIRLLEHSNIDVLSADELCSGMTSKELFRCELLVHDQEKLTEYLEFKFDILSKFKKNLHLVGTIPQATLELLSIGIAQDVLLPLLQLSESTGLPLLQLHSMIVDKQMQNIFAGDQTTRKRRIKKVGQPDLTFSN